MEKLGVFVLAGLKGIEIQENPLMAEACAELELAMFILKVSELAGRKGVSGQCPGL